MNDLEKFGYHLIDNEFIKIFQPIIITQTVLGSARIRVKYKYISGKTTLQKLYSVVLLLVSLLVYNFSVLFDFEFRYQAFSSTLDFIVLIQYLYISLDLSIRIITNTFMYNIQNAELFVLLQNVDRYMKINYLDGKYKNMYNNNLIRVILVLVIYIITSIWYYRWLDWGALFLIVFATEELELLSFSSIVDFLHLRLKHVNDLIDKYNKVKWHTFIRDDLEKCSYRDLLKGFHNIAVIYYLVQKLYSIFVSSILYYT